MNGRLEGAQLAQGIGSRRWSTATIVTAVVSAFAASACCIGPLVFAVLGIGGAGLLIKFEPYRPLFMTVTFLLLGAGFYLEYRKPKVKATADGDACGCEMPKANKAGRWMLWIATVVVGLFLVFPYLAPLLFE
jgi:mercuric ion transport protein